MPARRLGTLAHIPDPSALYTDHRRLLLQIAGKYSSTYGLETTDLESVGSEVFLRCMKRWDPRRGKFSTYLTICLKSAFNNLVRKEGREPCSTILNPSEFNEEGEDGKRMTNPFTKTHTPFHDPLWLEDIVKSLSEDAREVVRLLFEDDLGPTVSDHPVYVKAALKRALGKEWGQHRIAKAFESITKTLSQ